MSLNPQYLHKKLMAEAPFFMRYQAGEEVSKWQEKAREKLGALLGLPLQIDEWTVHQYTGVDYVPQFFDAAVGTYTDLKFTNTLPYPIRISTLHEEGVVTVLIYREGEGI